MLGGNLTKRLEDVRVEVRRVREALRIVDEQVAFQQGVAGEAETNAVVAETPLAHRDHREAHGDLQRLQRQRAELHEQLTSLSREQDELLERMFEQGAAS